MKLRKIFAGMAASAIAMTAFAVSASAYNAGIAFQTADTWNFRNPYYENGEESGVAQFPAKAVGVQGGGYGLDTEANCTDVSFEYDGTYTVSIATSGTIKEENPEYADKDDNGFYLDEEKTLTRAGSPWSMLTAYAPAESEETEITQDQIEWVGADPATTTKFNTVLVTTDIPCTYDDNDQPLVNDKAVTVKDVVVDMCGTEYTPQDAVCFKSDSDYLTIAIINAYGDSTIDETALPAQDGNISVTFTIEGLAEAPAEESSAADTTESEAASSADSATTSTSASTSKPSTTTSTANGTSDNTNQPTGAAAGIALAGIALAGAAIVVAKKK
ncbi:NPXTG-anchored protein [Ruminococcus sp. Marseille-P6503]|uniref:NPXTG-anchored protein n=1 Tax=Ruminococcus sp. Marseille-P6503 TaxID=2364796 RepID=UPI000F52C888|nr:NPXTG-anchored protein [Ruminococcus sp. Marseille-P6503]